MSDAAEAPGATSRVGPRLKRLRRLRGATLQEAAREAGISHSFLSMLERGLADISVNRLTRLAELYGISMSELLVDDATDGAPVVISADDMLLADRGTGIRYRFLPASTISGLQLIHVEFEPGAGFESMLAHRGEDFCWVVRGELTLLDGDGEYRVERNQAVAYSATVPHAFRNHTRRPAEMVAMTSPPYW